MGAGMMRAAAKAVLKLYPKAWRERYGEEVGDLIASRPVRPRTVLDLIRGAGDAWLHFRRGPWRFRIPLWLVLLVSSYALFVLWNPGVRDMPSLHGAWAEAAGTGALAESLRHSATLLFVTAAASAVLAAAMMLITSCAALRSREPIARGLASLMIVTGLVLAVPMGLLVWFFYALAFAQAGYPVGPLGDAMTGGFFVPVAMALVLPLLTLAASAPGLAAGVRASASTLAVAAICTGLGWLFVAALVVLGLPKASEGFVTAVAASALLSVAMATVVARRALQQRRAATGLLTLV
ncbi:hypothetical protein [Nonomuraea sp. NPDC049480]|uniref:hypothetical protein n=1 Tax=Nonomuraea sp. NPDC049480 TaxID=3364353 RepID=UPI0037AB614E